jgi:thiaminase/transcriptional activator TenA
MTFIDELRDAVRPEWDAYIGHRFVTQLGAGTLPLPAFQDYLLQDYLFLLQFARAHALAAYKSTTLEDLERGSAALSTTLSEMTLHTDFARSWGISPEQMLTTEERTGTTAYTRYVLDVASRGDLLDLLVAMAPCAIGYGVIGLNLSPELEREDHPYRAWIADYAGEAYQAMVREETMRLDVLAERALTPYRRTALVETFRRAVLLETAFWEQSVDVGQI